MNTGVVQVVDLALVVKQDKRAVAGDPLQRVMAPVQHNYHDLQSSYCLLAWEKAQSSPANIQTTYDWAYQRTPLDQCKIGSDAKRGKNVICQKPLGGWTLRL